MGKRIGEILIENGWAEASVVKRALAKHRPAGARLCSFLIAHGVLDPDHASRALGELHGVAAVLQKHLERRDPSLASLLPATVARASVALPIGRMGNGDLIICVRDPSPAVQRQLERTLRETIVLAVAPAQQLEELVAETYGRDDEMDVDIDIDVDTPPKMSLELDDEEDLSNLELVELDDHGVDKDASQSLQFTAPAQRASQASMAGIALPRTLTPPPEDVINPPTNRGGATGLDVLKEPTQRTPRIDPLNPPSQRAPRTPPGRAALELASQPAITVPPVEPEPPRPPQAAPPPPRASEPVLPARTRTPLDAPTARAASSRDYFAARTSSRSDIIPVAALDELDPVTPATVSALAAGSVVPQDDAVARAREVAAVLSLELDEPVPRRMESQHDADLDLGLAPTVMSPLGPRVDVEPAPEPVVAPRPSKSMPAPSAGRSVTRDTSPMALTARSPASPAPVVPPPEPAPPPVKPPTLAGSSLATPPAGVPIVRPAIPSIPKVPAKIPSIPKPAAAKPALDVSPLERATSLDDAIEMVMTLARSCWSAALLLDVDETAAAGRRGFGPQLTDDDAMWIMITFDEPSVISLATRATDVITGDTHDNEPQRLVAKAVGSPASAVAVRSRGAVVFVLVVGPPVGDGSVAALARLGAALGHAVARIAAR